MKGVFREGLERTFREHGLEDFKWIEPKEIVVSHWVRLKCHFGCRNFGSASCPPNNPLVQECREIISEYADAVVFRLLNPLDNPVDRDSWVSKESQRLRDVERAVFLSGHYKTFLLSAFHCTLCEECATVKADCRHKNETRPTPEGMGVDVYATVSSLGFPIEVLKDRSKDENRYAILLIR